jgi:hypothetical protein
MRCRRADRGCRKTKEQELTMVVVVLFFMMLCLKDVTIRAQPHQSNPPWSCSNGWNGRVSISQHRWSTTSPSSCWCSWSAVNREHTRSTANTTSNIPSSCTWPVVKHSDRHSEEWQNPDHGHRVLCSSPIQLRTRNIPNLPSWS